MPDLDLKPDLTLDPDTAFHIVLKAREFDVKEEEVDPDEGSNPSDDRDIDVLQFQADDAVEDELTAAIGSLNEDQQLDLIALVRIGRGDFDLREWAEARETARGVDPSRIAPYVMGIPNVGDYLEEALTQLGYSMDDHLDSHLYGVTAPTVAGTE